MSNVDYLGALSSSTVPQISHDQTVFQAQLDAMDDNTAKGGNSDDKIDEKELKAVFEEMGLSSSEARELAKYFFKSSNGFMKSNGSLDVAKVFEFLDSDDNDSEVSTAELKMTGAMARSNTAPASGNTQETTIGTGSDAFKITEEHREIAMGMVKSDGTLDEEKLKQWFNSTPPPSEEDKKAVVYLALLAAGYEEADILENLENIITQLEGSSGDATTSEPNNKLKRSDVKNRIGEHVTGTTVEDDDIEQEIIDMLTEMGMGEEIAKKLAKEYMKSSLYTNAKGKPTEDEIEDAITNGLFKFLGEEDDEALDAQDVFENNGEGQVKGQILNKMKGGLENLSSPPTADEIETFLGSGDIDLDDDEKLGELIEVMLGNKATPENVKKVREKLKEKLGGEDTATAAEIAGEIEAIIEDVEEGTETAEGSGKSYTEAEFSNMIKHDDPAHAGKINPQKLEKELIALGVDPARAKAFATLSTGEKTADIVNKLKGSDGKITAESVNEALDNLSYKASDIKNKIDDGTGKLDIAKLENFFIAMGMDPAEAKTFSSSFKGKTPEEVTDLLKDTEGNITLKSIEAKQDKQSYGGYELRDAVKGADGKVDTGKLAEIFVSMGIEEEIAKEFAKTFEGKNADSNFLHSLDDEQGNITRDSVEDAINNQSMSKDEFKGKIDDNPDSGLSFNSQALIDLLESMGVPTHYAKQMVEQLKQSKPTLDELANMFADPNGNITSSSAMDAVLNAIDENLEDTELAETKKLNEVKQILQAAGIDTAALKPEFLAEFAKQFGHLDPEKIKLMLDANGDGKLDNADQSGLNSYTKDDLDRGKQLAKIDSFRINGSDDTKVNQLNDKDKAEILKILRLSGLTESDGTPYELDDIKDLSLGVIKYMINK